MIDFAFVTGGALLGARRSALGKLSASRRTLYSHGQRRGVVRGALATRETEIEFEVKEQEGKGSGTSSDGFPRDEELLWETDQGYEVVDERTGLPLRYDGKVIRKYWDKKPVELQRRWTYFLSIVVPFGTKLVRNLTAGTVDRNQAELARDLRIVLEKLGPTFVKLGQVLSIRPDIVGQDASDELALLQDSVPVFPTDVARELIEEELGRPLEEVFSEFSEEPVAAASLAQVYRAKLRDSGREVAVKVQRPGLLSVVTKDLYVMRRGIEWMQPIQKRFSAERTDYMELLNTWASGFYEELDFKNEAFNQKQFKRLLEASGLDEIVVPEVVEELSTRRLLVSEWINGEKLTKSSAEEIRTFVDIGNEAFLTQLLDWGVFHGDPHPGNLLVTDEGKLCILDFGLMASIPEEDRDQMVSAVIHVANKDFGQLVDDMIKLKFLPTDVDRAKVEVVMAKVLGPFVYQGGGVNNVDFRSLARDLSGVAREIPFSIPPYYALVGRAIISLEGIALQAYPDYRLVMEAYPYVARRIMTDGDTPELQKALSEILYTDGDFSMRRFAGLVNSAMGNVGLSKDAIVDLDAVPEDGADLAKMTEFILSDDGKLVRSTLSAEIARGVDIFFRRAVLVQTNNVMSSMLRVPAPFRFGFEQVQRANDLSAVTKQEELFLDGLLKALSGVVETDVRDSFNDPLQVLTLLPKLLTNRQMQDVLEVVRANQSAATEFTSDVTSHVRTVGSRRFYDEFLPVAFPTLTPALRALSTSILGSRRTRS